MPTPTQLAQPATGHSEVMDHEAAHAERVHELIQRWDLYPAIAEQVLGGWTSDQLDEIISREAGWESERGILGILNQWTAAMGTTLHPHLCQPHAAWPIHHRQCILVVAQRFDEWPHRCV